MENEEVGKMLANIYRNLALTQLEQDEGAKKFKYGLFNFYVTMDNVYDNGDTESAILHFAERIYLKGLINDFDLDEFLKDFYKLAYFKGKTLKLGSLGNRAIVQTKKAQEEIDAAVKSIIVSKNRKTEYLKKSFTSEEFKQYAKIIQDLSKDGYENLHLTQLGNFAESFKEVQRNVKMYDTNIDKARTELYNMMTYSTFDSIQDFNSEIFEAFLEKEIARVSAQEKTKTNPDGQGK